MEKSLSSIFKNVVLMSGTPDEKQVKLTRAFPENECCCSPKTAIENGWICKPTLNLIDCEKNAWPSAVRAVFEREIAIYEEEKIFKPVILVNCASIDDIYKLRNTTWFKENTGKLFHFISIHSSKSILSPDEVSAQDVTAEIDGISVTSNEAYDEVERIDEYIEAGDDLPVIVAQVQMIGEGINVSAFNAVITASSTDKTAMQQIGRAVRNFTVDKYVEEDTLEEVTTTRVKAGLFNRLFKRVETIVETKLVKRAVKKTYSKVKDGHANVYVLNDNIDDVVQLICNLDQYDLTSHCYSWGKRIDQREGSSYVTEARDYAEAVENKWVDIDETDPQIIQITNNAHKEILALANKNWVSNGEDNDGNGIADCDELGALLRSDHMKTIKEVYCGTGKMTNGEMFNILMNQIASSLMVEGYKKVWNKSHLALLNVVFNDGDESKNATELALFFNTHLNKRQIAQLNAI